MSEKKTVIKKPGRFLKEETVRSKNAQSRLINTEVIKGLTLDLHLTLFRILRQISRIKIGFLACQKVTAIMMALILVSPLRLIPSGNRMLNC